MISLLMLMLHVPDITQPHLFPKGVEMCVVFVCMHEIVHACGCLYVLVGCMCVYSMCVCVTFGGERGES